MLSPKTKRNISRIIPFGVIWLVFAIVYVQLEKGILGDLDYYPSTGNPYNFHQNIFTTSISSLVTGLLIGAMEIRYFSKLFIQESFTSKIVKKSAIYLSIIVSFLLIITSIANSIELKSGIFNKDVWTNVWAFASDFAFWSVTSYMAAIILITQFYNEVSENIGQSVLHNFFTGKYHLPTEEERIFMFLDMRSSSTIAENLGHIRYFQLLKEYYSDLSDPIIAYSGEVYQYVGDEIIVSWMLAKGLTDNRCLQCFFAMQSSLKKQARKYHDKFGLLPEFKAALHLGKVTTGEIGDIKKEIIFTGDVLNTTSRIQGLCNSYKVDLLVSGDLVKKMHHNSQFPIISLGETELRGREERVELFTIRPIN